MTKLEKKIIKEIFTKNGWKVLDIEVYRNGMQSNIVVVDKNHIVRQYVVSIEDFINSSFGRIKVQYLIFANSNWYDDTLIL